MVCPACGQNNQGNSDYCIYCGSAMNRNRPQNPYTPPSNQYASPQPGSAPYVQNNYTMYKPDETVTMGEWFVFFLIMCIPIVNIVMLFVWAFGSGTKPSKANLCKLQLLLMLIGVGIGIIVMIIVASLGISLFSNSGWYY